MSEELTFSHTQKGKRKACYQGYCFNFDKYSKSDSTLSFWQCEDYKKAEVKCKGRIHIKDGRVCKSQGSHNHAPNGLKQHVLELRHKIKVAAKNSNEATTALLMKATEEYPSTVVSQLSSENTLKRTVQQTRNKAANVVSEPRTVQELVIPVEFQQLTSGTTFLLYDSGPTSERFLIFGTESNLRHLAQSKSVFSDGTFSSAPSKLFTQLYTIHVSTFGTVVPLLYVLLPNKSFATYNRLFSVIKNLQPQFRPSEWMTDFETAAINAIRVNFPQVAVSGCFFHLQQCMWRKIQNLGLANAYREDDGHFALCA